MSDELYGINVRGPDDIIAARSYPEAVEMAQRLNAAFAAHVATKHHIYDPLIWAIPGVWLGTPESHAANLLNPGSDYAGLVADVRTEAA
jgi:hypothetical protein